MSSMMRRCAVRMSYQGRFKVKVIVHVKRCITAFRFRSISFEPVMECCNNSAQMSSMMRRCAVRMFHQGRFKVKVIVQSLTLYPGGIHN